MLYRRMSVPSFRFQSSFGEFDRLRRQMDQLLGAYGGAYRAEHRAGVFPLVNLTEDADSFFIRAELPGILAEDLDIQTTGSSVTISGERKIFAEVEQARYHRRERNAGKFSRVVSLPDSIDFDKTEATLTDGILTITVPKAEAAKPRQIAVK
jgi:HSP20 family protein